MIGLPDHCGTPFQNICYVRKHNIYFSCLSSHNVDEVNGDEGTADDIEKDVKGRGWL